MQGGDYGKALRRLESSAYKAIKDGVTSDGHNQQVSEEDEKRATQRGLRRAELELGLHAIADNREQRVRDGYDDRIVRLPSVQRSGSTVRRPSFYEQCK